MQSFVPDFLQSIFEVHPCCSMCQWFFSLYCRIIFYHMDMPQFVYSFISWWICGLFPLGSYIICCCEYSHVLFCMDVNFHFFWVDYLGMESLGCMVNLSLRLVSPHFCRGLTVEDNVQRWCVLSFLYLPPQDSLSALLHPPPCPRRLTCTRDLSWPLVSAGFVGVGRQW